MEHPKRKRIRLKAYDYSQNGAYFVTICSKEREMIFWGVGANSGRPQEEQPLSDIGILVNNEIDKLSDIYSNVTVEKSIIMPNHVHMIIQVNQKEDGRLETAPTISRIVQQFKGSVSKQAGFSVWQKSFYEHIIRNEQDYLEIWEYIENNPRRWEADKYYGAYRFLGR